MSGNVLPCRLFNLQVAIAAAAVEPPFEVTNHEQFLPV
jgi:hypothetical protein